MTMEFDHAQRLAVCPSCGSTALEPFISSQDFHYGIDGTFDTDRCAVCGLVILSPMPSAEDLGKLYPEDYYSYQPPFINKSFRRRLAIVFGLRKTTYTPQYDRPGRLLDIGCGAGQFMLEMQQAGWTAQGVELSRGAADAGRMAGLDIFGGELRQANFPDDTFDFVRSNHSFEHMPDPGVNLDEMRRILKPQGKLFIGIPNLDGAWAKLFGKYWWNLGLPVHPYNYTIRSIETLLQRHRLKVEAIRYNSDYAGLLGSAQIRANASSGKRSSQGAYISNWALKIAASLLSRGMDALHKGDCIEIICSKI